MLFTQNKHTQNKHKYLQFIEYMKQKFCKNAPDAHNISKSETVSLFRAGLLS